MVTTFISGVVINIAEPNATYERNSNNNQHLKINIIEQNIKILRTQLKYRASGGRRLTENRRISSTLHPDV